MINPVNHASAEAAIATYKVEPYVVAADVYAVAPHTGRGGWTWYTGSAGRMYRLIVESLLGLKREGDKLLCRWLLLSLDRLQGDELVMTQELIGNMLGVRREGVTEAAGRLQHDGLIHYSRGHIKVRDRARLEKRVCECYAVVKNEYDRLLPYKIYGLPNASS